MQYGSTFSMMHPKIYYNKIVNKDDRQGDGLVQRIVGFILSICLWPNVSPVHAVTVIAVSRVKTGPHQSSNLILNCENI